MSGTRKMIATLSLTLVAYAAAALSTLVVAEERWVEGQHYQTLTPPVAVGRGSDVVVTEFFWYGCGHCYTFEPMLTAWGKQLPDDAVLQPSPAVWNDPDAYARQGVLHRGSVGRQGDAAPGYF